jgi:transcriptional regulator with XRE-family HTH domain
MTRATQLDRDIGARLRALRTQRKLSQPVVARALGVTYQSYQKMEAGKVSLRASTLATLAKFYKVPVASLFGV